MTTSSARSPRRGEIWSVYTPGQPDDPHQPRPALVLSEETRNRYANDRIVVPVFSSGHPGPTRIFLPGGSGGIPHDSVLFCEELTTLHLSYFSRGPMGRALAEEFLLLVVKGVRRSLGDPAAWP